MHLMRRMIGSKIPVGKDEHLLLKRILLYAIVVVKSRLSAPADVEGGVNILSAPLKDLAKLLPVVNLFKLQFFDGRACYNQPVKLLNPTSLKVL